MNNPKTCPKCGDPHEKPGTFCSRRCANSRTFSEDAKRLKSEKNKQHWQTLDEDSQEQRRKQLSDVQAEGNKVVQEYWKCVPFEHLTSVDGRRKRILLEQDHKCGRCSLDEWMGEELPFELEHIDANRNNNVRENLIMLCPNCHSITPTWRGKKNGMTGLVENEKLMAALREHKSPYAALDACGMAPAGTNLKRAKKLLKVIHTSTD